MRFSSILLALTLAPIAAACSQQQSQQTQGPSATASPAAVVTATPRAVRTASAGLKPARPVTASPSPVPVPTPTPIPTKIPRLPPDAPPHILSIVVDKSTVSSGDRVSGTVLTTSNVASVEVRVAGYGVSLNKVGVGRFSLVYTLGNLPFFVRGTYAMQVIARNSRGDATQRSVPIVVR